MTSDGKIRTAREAIKEAIARSQPAVGQDGHTRVVTVAALYDLGERCIADHPSAADVRRAAIAECIHALRFMSCTCSQQLGALLDGPAPNAANVKLLKIRSHMYDASRACEQCATAIARMISESEDAAEGGAP